MSEIHSSRISAFKNVSKTNQDLRRKRAELSVALRKQARDEQLQKRRAFSPDGSEEEAIENEVLPNPEEIVKGLQSEDAQTLLKYARAARRTLSREQNPPIAVMINAGCVGLLIKALDRFDCPDIQFEASWALTNIASGTKEQTMTVVENGAVPKLVELLSSADAVAEQCAWALGNIAGDGAATRDLVLHHGVVTRLIPLLKIDVPKTRLRTAVWTYSNLCRNKNPLVDFNSVAPVLPHLSELLVIDDQDVLADACWALSYLTDGPNDRIEKVQSTPNILRRVVALLAHSSASVRTPALRATGNMLTGTDEQTDRVLESGAINHLVSLLRCNKSALVKEAAWAASNILAGTHAQIDKGIEHDLVKALIETLGHAEPRCQKEAAWAITNLCLGGSGPQLGYLLAENVLGPYTALLGSQDTKTVAVVLDGIVNLLEAAEKYGETEQLCMRFEEVGAVDKIESLQHHANEQIYKKTVNIIERFFTPEDENTENVNPENNEFRFGTTTDDFVAKF